MGGISGSKGIQYGRDHTYTTTTCSIFEYRRDRLYQSWKEGGFILVDQTFLVCEIIDPYASRSALVLCAADIKPKNDWENRKRGYEGQIEEPYPVEKLQKARGSIQSNDQMHSQVGVLEAHKNIQDKYLQLHFIPSLYSNRIPVSEENLRRLYAVVQMSQQL